MNKRRRMGPKSRVQIGHTTQRGHTFFPSTAVECFSKMLQDQLFCDVTFLVGEAEEEIKAHKCVLMARSEMLRAQFGGDWENSEKIPLPQFEPHEFRAFLKFVYTDEAVWYGEWKSLLKLGHYFLVRPLVSVCAEAGVKTARTDIRKTLEAFQLARLYDQKNMLDRIGDFMAKSFIELSRTETFKEKVDDDTLRYLLSLDHLRVKECDLFQIVLSIAEFRARKSVLNGTETVTVAGEMEKFLPLIRFPTMGPNEFRTIVDASKLLPSDTVINLYRYFVATDGAEKRAIASTWVYSDVQRRGTQFLELTSHSYGWRQRKETMFSGQLEEHLSFTMSTTNLPSSATSDDDGANALAMTGIGIQCPRVMYDGTEITENLSCRVEIHQQDQQTNVDQQPHHSLASKLQKMARLVKPNEWTEVCVNPPLVLPSGSTKAVRINAQIDIGPREGKAWREDGTFLEYQYMDPKWGTVDAQICNMKVAISELRGPMFCKLIRGVRIQAMC